jgi:hypothetical protein
MTLAPDPNNIILGKGELFFDRFSAAGVRQGYFHLGNCSKFAIVLNDDLLTLNTSQDTAAGLLKRVTRKREVDVQISSNEFSIESMALALMGDQGTFTQASSSITGEILTTSVAKGRFYKTANRNISGQVITQGTVTWAATTDYTVYDASLGVIQVKATPSTAVTTATTATISYTRATLSLDQIVGATKTKIEGSLLFVPDPTTGPQFDVEIWRTSLSPGGEVGLISEDWGEYQLNLAVLDDSAGTYGGSASQPYFRLIQRGTA